VNTTDRPIVPSACRTDIKSRTWLDLQLLLREPGGPIGETHYQVGGTRSLAERAQEDAVMSVASDLERLHTYCKQLQQYSGP